MNDAPSHRLKKLKRRLRDEVRARRDALPAEQRAAASRAIAERVLALPEIEAARTVMAFWSFGSEVDTAPLLEGLVRAEIRVTLPRVEGSDAVPVVYAPGDPVRAAPFGAMEPVGGEPVEPADLDAIIVPGVAFDRGGGRVGYGGGFYDRLLPRKRSDVPAIGVAFSAQLVELTPAGPMDRAVDLVVTERETIRLAK